MSCPIEENPTSLFLGAPREVTEAEQHQFADFSIQAADEAAKFSLNFNAKPDESFSTMARFGIALY